MNRRWRIVLLILAGVMVFSLVGCSIKFGWSSKSSKASMTARFACFNGTNSRSVALAAGDVILIDYAVALKKGNLTILLSGPDGEVARAEGTLGDNTGRISFDAPVAGNYHVNLTGESAGGSYDVKWTIQKPKG